MEHIQPSHVHDTLAENMLVDGYDIVLDLHKSQGGYIFDSREGATQY